MLTDDLIVDGVSESSLLFDSIIQRVRPVDEAFSVVLATGDVLRFRHVLGRDAFRQIRQAAHRFADGVTRLNAPIQVREFVSDDRSTMVWCHLLGALSLDGGGVWEFLRLQHFGPVVFEDLVEQFKAELIHVAEQVETREIDRAKKGSRSRCCGATGSKSHRTRGESIPMS